MKRLGLIILVGALLGGGTISAQQDILFSQMKDSPMNLNPALAGVFHGTFRLANTYRSQWMSVSEPFVTMSGSLDMPVVTNVFNNDLFGVGVNFYNDKLGDSQLSTTKVNITGSYGKALDSRQQNFLSVGFQVGLAQRSVDFTDLYWDEQWAIEGFRLSLPSGETPPRDVKSYWDFATGLHYFYNSQRLFKFSTGLSYWHFTRPNIGLFGETDKLFAKYIYQIGFEHGLRDNSHFVLAPNVYFMQQGPNRFLMAGSDFVFILNDPTEYTGLLKEVSLSLGGYVRFGDAFIPQMRLSFGGLWMGGSYDLTTSQMNRANGGQGGPEFTLGYRGGYKKGHRGGHFSDRFK